jgi:hypothetical protein
VEETALITTLVGYQTATTALSALNKRMENDIVTITGIMTAVAY